MTEHEVCKACNGTGENVPMNHECYICAGNKLEPMDGDCYCFPGGRIVFEPEWSVQEPWHIYYDRTEDIYKTPNLGQARNYVRNVHYQNVIVKLGPSHLNDPLNKIRGALNHEESMLAPRTGAFWGAVWLQLESYTPYGSIRVRMEALTGVRIGAVYRGPMKISRIVFDVDASIVETPDTKDFFEGGCIKGHMPSVSFWRTKQTVKLNGHRYLVAIYPQDIR